MPSIPDFRGTAPGLRPLPAGVAGTARTVAVMADLSAGPWGAQSPRIRDLAMGIVQRSGIDARDYRGEVDAIHAWMQRAIRYTRDPVAVERVQTPEHTAFVSRSGDCDDAAVLETALLGALGHRTRFVTIGFGPAGFSHVFAEVDMHGTWLPIDAITDHPAGWQATGTTRRTVWPINAPGGFDATAAMRGRGRGLSDAVPTTHNRQPEKATHNRQPTTEKQPKVHGSNSAGYV